MARGGRGQRALEVERRPVILVLDTILDSSSHILSRLKNMLPDQ
jgi:hypothetical protein